jgi:hypothetical protein
VGASFTSRLVQWLDLFYLTYFICFTFGRWLAQLSDEEKRVIEEHQVPLAGSERERERENRQHAQAPGTLVEGQRATDEEADGGAEAERRSVLCARPCAACHSRRGNAREHLLCRISCKQAASILKSL